MDGNQQQVLLSESNCLERRAEQRETENQIPSPTPATLRLPASPELSTINLGMHKKCTFLGLCFFIPSLITLLRWWLLIE